jgi:hypothetical protein
MVGKKIMIPSSGSISLTVGAGGAGGALGGNNSGSDGGHTIIDIAGGGYYRLGGGDRGISYNQPGDGGQVYASGTGTTIAKNYLCVSQAYSAGGYITHAGKGNNDALGFDAAGRLTPGGVPNTSETNLNEGVSGLEGNRMFGGGGGGYGLTGQSRGSGDGYAPGWRENAFDDTGDFGGAGGSSFGPGGCPSSALSATYSAPGPGGGGAGGINQASDKPGQNGGDGIVVIQYWLK